MFFDLKVAELAAMSFVPNQQVLFLSPIRGQRAELVHMYFKENLDVAKDDPLPEQISLKLSWVS